MKLRKLVLNDETYLWGVSHRNSERQCVYTFTSYLEGRKASPLRVVIETSKDDRIGAGVFRFDSMGSESADINLNEPGLATKVIRHARAEGWQPNQMRKRFIVEHGLPYLLTAIGLKNRD